MDSIAELAQIFMLDQRTKEAEDLLRKALIDDDRLIYHRLLGGLLTDTGRHDEAEPILRHVLKLEPDNSYVLLKLARICAARHQPSQAKELAQKALDPTRLEAAGLLHGLIVPSLLEAMAANLLNQKPGSKQEVSAAMLLRNLFFPNRARAAANHSGAEPSQPATT